MTNEIKIYVDRKGINWVENTATTAHPLSLRSFLFKKWYTRNVDISTDKTISLLSQAGYCDILQLFDLDERSLKGMHLGLSLSHVRAINKAVKKTKDMYWDFAKKWGVEKFQMYRLGVFCEDDLLEFDIWARIFGDDESDSEWKTFPVTTREQFWKRLETIGFGKRDKELSHELWGTMKLNLDV